MGRRKKLFSACADFFCPVSNTATIRESITNSGTHSKEAKCVACCQAKCFVRKYCPVILKPCKFSIYCPAKNLRITSTYGISQKTQTPAKLGRINASPFPAFLKAAKLPYFLFNFIFILFGLESEKFL